MKLADIQFSDRERVVIARLTGEIDLSNADSIERAIAEATPNHALALILDVGALDYLDSAGIHLIYKLREKLRARGQSLRLVIPPDSPANDALRLAGISRNVDTAESVETAMAEFTAAGAAAEGAPAEGAPAEGAPAEGAAAEVPDPGGA